MKRIFSFGLIVASLFLLSSGVQMGSTLQGADCCITGGDPTEK